MFSIVKHLIVEILIRRNIFCISNMKPDKFVFLKLVQKFKTKEAKRSKVVAVILDKFYLFLLHLV